MRSLIQTFVVSAAFSPLTCGAVFQGLSIKVGNETAPPGGMAQMKVVVTEPKPISTGSPSFAMDAALFGAVDGIAVHSPSGDVAGTAVKNGSSYQLTLVSPTTMFGTALDYPIITLTARVRPDAPLGARATVTLASGSVFRDPFGAPYPLEVNPGQMTVAEGVSITDVIPGSAVVPAGGEVVLRGVNFSPRASVRLSEVKLTAVRYISPTELRITLASSARMHGMRVRVDNGDGTSDTYYSYQRTKPVGASANALLSSTVPLFPDALHTSATFVRSAGVGRWFAVATQNITASPVNITLECLAASGAVLGSRALVLEPYERIARAESEIMSVAGGVFWRVRSSAPVQSLGLIGDDATRRVWPVHPSVAQ